ncbi:hypothetical protein [Streptomyces sp. NPDC001401]|uniref:hypothetical protein n=1 Tax=Streptomyces sp. NPDC001401 TaxID=3364570 RepID=UPI00369F6552
MSRPAAQKALDATERALSGVDEELERHATGQGSVSSAGQLTWIRSQLTRIADQLASPELPPKEQRACGVGRVITDSWPCDSRLSAAILEAEQLYLKA